MPVRQPGLGPGVQPGTGVRRVILGTGVRRVILSTGVRRPRRGVVATRRDIGRNTCV